MSADIAAASIARLQAENERLQAEIAELRHHLSPKPDAQNQEILRLRNELARANAHTNWVCKCGGTDSKGQKENADLWAAGSTLYRIVRDSNRPPAGWNSDQVEEALEKWRFLR